MSGEEQLSLGVRFVDTTNKEPAIRDEFLGFTSLAQTDAETIANTFIAQCTQFGLHFTKLLDQGYDGCSTTAGKVGGVQAKIKESSATAQATYLAWL